MNQQEQAELYANYAQNYGSKILSTPAGNDNVANANETAATNITGHVSADPSYSQYYNY